MTVAKRIEQAVNSRPVGSVFRVGDLNFPADFSANVKVKLNRMVREGRLQKLTNGKYYRAKKSIFGHLLPSTDELVKDILYPGGKIAGYITGNQVWTSMQLTSQFSGDLTIGVGGRREPLMRAGQKITFISQPNKITRKNIHLLQILDALKMIKKIPDTSVSASITQLKNIIHNLSEKDIDSIVRLAMKYPPRVRAMLGAILDDGIHIECAEALYNSLNQTSEYKIGISPDVKLNTNKWHLK